MAYLRVRVDGPCEGLDGTAKVLVSVVDRFLRTGDACVLVDESQLISMADAKKAVS